MNKTELQKIPAENWKAQGYKTKKEGVQSALEKQAERAKLASELKTVDKQGNSIVRYHRAKLNAALTIAQYNRLPTSSKNAEYSTVRGSTTVTTYAKSSKWGQSVASDTYVYFDSNRELCYETGRGRCGKSGIRVTSKYTDVADIGYYVGRRTFLSDTAYASMLGDVTIMDQSGKLYELRDRNGKIQSLAFVNDDEGIYEHGKTVHQIKREMQHKMIVKIRNERREKTEQKETHRAEIFLRLVKNAGFAVTYQDARNVGFCATGIKSFLRSVGISEERTVISYASLRKLREKDYRVDKVLISAIRREYAAMAV